MNGKVIDDSDLFDFSVFEKNHKEHRAFRSFLANYITKVIKLKINQYGLQDVIMENNLIKKTSEHMLKKYNSN